MANDKKPAAEAPKKKGKLLWIVLAVVLLGGGGGGAWYFMRPHAAPGAAGAAEHAAAPRAAAQYYKFDPAFVVNFGAEGNTRYLQVTVEAMSRDAALLETIKANEPAIRNDLVLLYSAQQYEVLVTPAGKEALRQGTLEAIRKVVAAEGGKGEAVEAVYFTSFVIQ